MDGRYLLDTNIAIRFLNSDPLIVERVGHTADTILCSIVLGELYFGAYKSQARRKNLESVRIFAQRGPVLACDERTADEYGKIKSELRTKGRPIPDNDIWIAALARQHQLTIATRDQHFKHVDGLTLEEW